MLRTALAALVLAVAAGCAGPTDDDGPPTGSSRRAITDGVAEPGHAAVGLIRAGDAVGCTATVVGRRTVLTAAHCIWPGQSQTVELQGHSYETVAATIHPGYDPDSHLDDIGLLTLERPVHVVPGAVDTQPRAVGAAITLVGFGATAQEAGDVGVKRRAVNTIASLHPGSFNIAGSGGGAGNVCHKDSGAPVLAGGQEPTGPQIGVVIGGQAPCGTLGVATRVDTRVSWLRAAARGDLAVADGARAPFGFPCAAAADCLGGLCQRDAASGDRFCSSACDDATGCPEDAPCAAGSGGAPRHCGLPPPPVPDEGCAVAPAGRTPRREGGTPRPPPALLLPGLALALVLALVRSATRRRR